jgi:hypothetical protein
LRNYTKNNVNGYLLIKIAKSKLKEKSDEWQSITDIGGWRQNVQRGCGCGRDAVDL